ncbi:DUF6296 family protein [Kitasatospora paranensis]|uniref:Anti-sigma factor antagonist n=1 Tax=Kitasatospora paranensis TaxID=258053 RepID=A0ABW2G7V3_9ACTN
MSENLGPLNRLTPALGPGTTATAVGSVEDLPDRLFARTMRGSDGVLRVHLSGEIDPENSDALRGVLLALGEERPSAVELDLHDVAFMDCSGLNVLLELRLQGIAAGFPVRLRAASRTVLRLLEVSETLPLFTGGRPVRGPVLTTRIQRWLLTFPGTPGCHADQPSVVVALIGTGPGGHPAYSDAAGTVRAEITATGHVHVLDSGPHPSPRTPPHAQPLT